MTKVLYYKSKQRCYDQSIALQNVNKDVMTKVLYYTKK